MPCAASVRDVVDRERNSPTILKRRDELSHIVGAIEARNVNSASGKARPSNALNLCDGSVDSLENASGSE
jgi:hypothetical protein